MEPAATSSLAAPGPPSPKMAHLGEAQAPAQPGLARSAFTPILFILLGVAVAWGLHRAGYDLGFAVITANVLTALCLCLWKIELLRRDPGGDPAAAARERRRVGLVAWAVSLAWISIVALHVASAASILVLVVALWVLAGLAMILAFYLLFAARRGDSRTDDTGRWPEKELHERSPEQRV